MALELFTYQNHVRLERTDIEDHLPGYIAFLRSHLGDGRVLNAGRNALYPEWGSALAIRQVEMMNTTQIPEYRAFFFTYVNPAEPSLFLQIGRNPGIPFRADPSALDLLSVRYLVVDQDMARFESEVAARYPLAYSDVKARVNVYENPAAFPRAYLSPALRAAPSPAPEASGWTMGTTLTWDRTFLDAAAAAGVPTSAPLQPAGSAQLIADHNDEVRVSVQAEVPSVLVLGDTYQGDWVATVNGQPAHIARVDQILRGVIVASGPSLVEFRYRSPGRRLGAVISTTTLIGLLGMTAVWARRRSSPRPKTGRGN